MENFIKINNKNQFDLLIEYVKNLNKKNITKINETVVEQLKNENEDIICDQNGVCKE